MKILFKRTFYFLILLLIGPCPVFAANETPDVSKLLATLSATTGCTANEQTTCSLTITDPLSFFNYFKSCHQLAYWEIYYMSTNNTKITLTADSTGYCKLIIHYGNKAESKTCLLSETDVTQMSGGGAAYSLQQLSTTGQIPLATMKTLFKPLYECINKEKAYIAPRFLQSAPILQPKK